MEKLNISLVIMIILTAISGFSSSKVSQYTALLVLAITAIKFLLISFHFMELNKAHSFWKIAVISYLILFIVVLVSVL